MFKQQCKTSRKRGLSLEVTNVAEGEVMSNLWSPQDDLYFYLYVGGIFVHRFSSSILRSKPQTPYVIYSGDFKIRFEHLSKHETKKFE